MRGIALAAAIFIVGCQSAPPPAPREQVPQPFTSNGVSFTFADERHDWEKQAVNGPTTIYRLGRVSPNPWTQLQKETETAVAALPEKPARVDVFVTSFRLVRREDKPSIHDPSDNVKIGNMPGSPSTGISSMNPNSSANRQAYNQLRLASDSRDQKQMDAASKNLVVPVIGDGPVKLPAPEEPEPASGSLAEHPPGASCRVRATVRLTFADGREKTMDIKAIAAGQNTTGSQYYGEALDFAAKMAVRQYGNQMRTNLGLPLD